MGFLNLRNNHIKNMIWLFVAIHSGSEQKRQSATVPAITTHLGILLSRDDCFRTTCAIPCKERLFVESRIVEQMVSSFYPPGELLIIYADAFGHLQS